MAASTLAQTSGAFAAGIQNLAGFDGTNGANPYASLTLSSNGTLYGTTLFTRSGSTGGYGTVYSFDPGTNTAVPEPLNILGAVTVLGLGAALKRRLR